MPGTAHAHRARGTVRVVVVIHEVLAFGPTLQRKQGGDELIVQKACLGDHLLFAVVDVVSALFNMEQACRRREGGGICERLHFDGADRYRKIKKGLPTACNLLASSKEP